MRGKTHKNARLRNHVCGTEMQFYETKERGFTKLKNKKGKGDKKLTR